MAEEDDDGGVDGLVEEVICAEGAPEWVVTFGDMMSLLLTFFILLLSFASMDAARFKQLAGTIKQGFGVIAPERPVALDRAETLIALTPRIDFNAKRILEKLRRRLDPKTRSRRTANVNIETFETYRGVVVLFPAAEVFEPGSARLRPGILPLIDYVGEVAEEAPDHELLVEARVMANGPNIYDDEWQLTTRQAVTLAQYLRRQGGLAPAKVVPTGRGTATPTQRPGRSKKRAGASVEFTFVSHPMRIK